jgi:predicted ATPase/ubiquinone/menaquinone biosynthesis C-methylase UbiE
MYQNINISEEFIKKYEVETIAFKNLTEVTALIGKNGSGKSRYLNAIKDGLKKIQLDDDEYFEEFILQKVFGENVSILAKSETELKLLKSGIIYHLYINYKKTNTTKVKLTQNDFNQKYSNQVTLNYVSSQNYQSDFNQIWPLVNGFVEQFKSRKIEEVLVLDSKALFIFDESNPVLKFIVDKNFLPTLQTPKQYFDFLCTDIADDFYDSFGDQQKFENSLFLKEFNEFRYILKRYSEKTPAYTKEVNRSPRDKFGAINQSILGKLKINDRFFAENELSDGEKIIYNLAFLEHLIKKNNLEIQKLIIIWDEPELHLHPEIEVVIIEFLREFLKGKGHLFIATHSINIVSSLQLEEIYVVKDNKLLKPSSKSLTLGIDELMGANSLMNNLSQLMTNVSDWTYCNFITECFDDPKVLNADNPKDPQLLQLKEILEDKTKNNLLDFGAGRGRLVNRLSLELGEERKISALEINEELHTEISSKIQCYKSYTELPKESFDLIFLCNVLHEIPLKEWEVNLNKIQECLKPNGILVIIEDLEMPHGEKIGRNGYLILDKQSFDILFNTKESTVIYSENEKYKDRIQCLVYKKEDIQKVNSPKIEIALKIRKENIKNQIIAIRESVNYEKTSKVDKMKYGRLLGLLNQQYINIDLNLESITGSNKFTKVKQKMDLVN